MEHSITTFKNVFQVSCLGQKLADSTYPTSVFSNQFGHRPRFFQGKEYVKKGMLFEQERKVLLKDKHDFKLVCTVLVFFYQNCSDLL